jgi:hypothetical protein
MEKYSESINQKSQDLDNPGLQIEFDHGEAEEVGAFVEDAVSLQTATESTVDIEINS